jgi:hypothetical protein
MAAEKSARYCRFPAARSDHGNWNLELQQFFVLQALTRSLIDEELSR